MPRRIRTLRPPPSQKRLHRRQRLRQSRRRIRRPLCRLPGLRLPQTFRSSFPLISFSFLKDYANQPAKTLLKDKRFHSLMKQAISSTEYHYGRDMSLSEAVETVLDGSMQPVQVRDSRFVLSPAATAPTLAAVAFSGSI